MRERSVADENRRRALEAFTRNKNRGGATEPKAARDWWARAISLFSLLIALSSLFFSFLLQRDHLSLVVGNLPLAIRKSDGTVSLHFAYGDPEITFINSGNHPAAIAYFEATARVIKASKPDPLECSPQGVGDQYALPVRIPNLVVKPGEILSAQVQIPKKDPENSIDIPKDKFTARAGDEVMICLHFDIITPANVSRNHPVLAYLVSFDEYLGATLMPQGPIDALNNVYVRFW